MRYEIELSGDTEHPSEVKDIVLTMPHWHRLNLYSPHRKLSGVDCGFYSSESEPPAELLSLLEKVTYTVTDLWAEEMAKIGNFVLEEDFIAYDGREASLSSSGL